MRGVIGCGMRTVDLARFLKNEPACVQRSAGDIAFAADEHAELIGAVELWRIDDVAPVQRFVGQGGYQAELNHRAGLRVADAEGVVSDRPRWSHARPGVFGPEADVKVIAVKCDEIFPVEHRVAADQSLAGNGLASFSVSAVAPTLSEPAPALVTSTSAPWAST